MSGAWSRIFGSPGFTSITLSPWRIPSRSRFPRSSACIFPIIIPSITGKKAFVYANVIRNKDKDPEGLPELPALPWKNLWWTSLCSAISTTTWPSFMRSLSRESLLNRRMAENLSRLLFTCRIQVEDPSIRYVLVYHEELKKEEKCPLKSGRANVQIYTENHQDFPGGRGMETGTKSSIPYTIKNMLTDIRFREYCLRSGSGQRRSSPEYLQQREA